MATLAPPLPAAAVDTALIRKTLDHVTAHPEQHRQDVWWHERPACGSVGCFAGWAAHHCGYDVTLSHNVRFDNGDELVSAIPLTVVRGPGLPLDGMHIEDAAARLLGLTEQQADLLFDGDNTLRDLYGLAHRYTCGDIDIPATLPDGS